MRNKLNTAALLALSVVALTAEITDVTNVQYEVADLEAAIEAEERVTAIEALEAAIEAKAVTVSVSPSGAVALTPAEKYEVAAGFAITSKKGILSGGDEVKTDYLHGGEKSFKKLIENGHVVRKA